MGTQPLPLPLSLHLLLLFWLVIPVGNLLLLLPLLVFRRHPEPSAKDPPHFAHC